MRGGGTLLPLRDSTSCRPKESPLWYFFRNPFLADLWRQYILTLRGSARQKKTRFFCQKFWKSTQKRLFWPFFQKFACCAKFFCQNRGKTVLWESSKNQFGRPKKKGQNFRIFFENPPPPRENPRSAPDLIGVVYDKEKVNTNRRSSSGIRHPADP